MRITADARYCPTCGEALTDGGRAEHRQNKRPEQAAPPVQQPPPPPSKEISAPKKETSAPKEVQAQREPQYPAGSRVKNPTGIVSVAEHLTRTSTSFHPQPGGAGVSRTTSQLNYVRFRVGLSSGREGGRAQVSVQMNVDRTDLYIQEGDTVTLIGNYKSGGLAKNPVLVNHTARVVVWPKGAYSAPTLLYMAGVGSVFLLVGSFLAVRVFVIGIFPLLIGVGIVGACVATLIWRFLKALARTLNISAEQSEVRRVTADWPDRTYRDPSGVVEGVTSISRGGNVPTEWTIFRMALHDGNGELLDRLAWAIPLRKLNGELRRGDSVRVPGHWKTGVIGRAYKVVML